LKIINFIYLININRFATEAAITILRIDDLFRLEPPPEDKEKGGRHM